MARRSNKTAHVLGLITSGNKAEEEELVETAAPATAESVAEDPSLDRERSSLPANEGDAGSQAAETKAQTKIGPEAKAEPPAGENAPAQKEDAPEPKTAAQDQEVAVQVADVAPEGPAEGSSYIPTNNPSLKRIVAGESKAQRSNVKTPIVEILFNDHDPLSDLIRDQLEAGEAMAEATRKEKIAMSEENKMNNPATNEPENDMVITKNPSNDYTYIKDRSTNESKELGYKFINVSEELVREKVLDIMGKVDMCTCDRCIVDTIALAVTNLPSKCVVADKDAVFPLLSYYRSKYATAVQTELMKAAMTIKENPHH